MTNVYSPTTAPNPKTSFLMVPSEHLDKTRFGLKLLEVLLSFVAFILEETVGSCNNCKPLYFFEFVSCTAFLFTALLLALLSTSLHLKVGISCWSRLDFIYTSVISVLFIISSIVFVSDNSGTSVEIVAAVFGFLSFLAFVADLVVFWRTKGNPFSREPTPETSNGGPVPPENERLNTEANGAQ